MPETIPSHLDEVGPEWLTGALRESGRLPLGRVREVEIQAFGEGVGILGQLGRVRAHYEGDAGGAPERMVVKVPSVHATNREMCFALGFYQREVRFYRELAPELPFRIPLCYAAQLDEQRKRFALVLEDLSFLSTADQLEGISGERAERAVDLLAEIHASRWGDPRFDALEWIPRTNSPTTLEWQDYYRRAWPGFVRNVGDQLSPKALEIGERVNRALAPLLHALAAPPTTLVHNDFKLDNLLFGEPGGPDPIALVDWQVITRGRGIQDLAYLICQSMTVEARLAQEEDLLGRWHRRLTESGVRGYDFEQARLDYRRSVMRGLAVPVEMGGSLDLGNERGAALVREIVERSFRAALDWDVLDVLPD